MTYRCDYCKSESNSVSAMLACEEECAESDRQTHGWFSRKDIHRKD